LDSVFVGRLDDDQAQADALRLLKVPDDAGYRAVIANLSRRPGGNRGTERDRAPRQFVFADGAGGVERIRVDFSGEHLAQLRDVLDTTPGQAARPPAVTASMPARAARPEPVARPSDAARSATSAAEPTGYSGPPPEYLELDDDPDALAARLGPQENRGEVSA
jgi:hypothetical protein